MDNQDEKLEIKVTGSSEYDYNSGVDALFCAEDPDALPESENPHATAQMAEDKRMLGNAQVIIPSVNKNAAPPEPELPKGRISDVRRANLTDLLAILKSLPEGA